MNSHPVAIPDTLPDDDRPAAITTYKGFDKNLRCRDFQYAIGQTYETDRAVACKTGFHACKYPLDVFGYYAPAESRFAVVEQSGDMARHNDDSKIASSRIAISAEIDIAGLVKAAVSYTVSRCSAPDPESPATNTGDRSAADVQGDGSVAVSIGAQGRARAVAGSAIVLCYRDNDGTLLHIRASKVGENGIAADTWYSLDESGDFVEVSP